MTDPFIHQLVKERHAELTADAEQRRLARLRPAKEPLVRIRLTLELQLGRKQSA